MTEERLAELMVRAADGLLPAAEQRELNTYLRDHPKLREDLEAHVQLKAVTDGWIARLDSDLAEDRHQAQAMTRWEGGIGVGLLVVGLGVLIGFGLIEALMDPAAPLWLRGGLGLTASGTLVLLFSAIRWRLATHAQDAYKEIIR